MTENVHQITESIDTPFSKFFASKHWWGWSPTELCHLDYNWLYFAGSARVLIETRFPGNHCTMTFPSCFLAQGPNRQNVHATLKSLVATNAWASSQTCTLSRMSFRGGGGGAGGVYLGGQIWSLHKCQFFMRRSDSVRLKFSLSYLKSIKTSV